jgi:putative hydrolases of HD superfamily
MGQKRKKQKKTGGTSDLIGFFVKAGKLKSEPRRGWVKKLSLDDPESVADHSYRTALMAMLFSDARGLDTEKAVRLALIHDLPEALVGDAMPEERSGESKIALETDAMEKLLSELPQAVRVSCRAAWHEYVSGRTPEAKLVNQLDKLEMAIQAWEYANATSGDPASAREFWSTAKAHLHDKELLELLQLVEV